jgi:hypothetical protein
LKKNLENVPEEHDLNKLISFIFVRRSSRAFLSPKFLQVQELLLVAGQSTC